MKRDSTGAVNPERDTSFRAEVIFWSWRTAVCAAPNFCLAWVGGFRSGAEIGAMLAGIATWVGISAAVTASDWFQRRCAGGRMGRSIRRAANVRVGWAVFAGLNLAFGSVGVGSGSHALNELFCLAVIPDFLMGALAMVAVARVAVPQTPDVADFDSFLLTYAITLLQGAWVVLTLLGIAGVLLLFRRRPKTPN